MLDPDDQLFPDARHIERHAIAFAQMMFAHAAFEREVRDLQGSIIDDPTFGERLRQWDGRSRPKRMVALIRSRLGDDLEETALVAKVLCDAIEPCDKRNLLAHGQWWCFNRRMEAWYHPSIA